MNAYPRIIPTQIDLNHTQGFIAMTNDFERTWQEKLRRAIVGVGGEKLANSVLLGGERLSDGSPRLEVIDWTNQALKMLEKEVSNDTIRELLPTCACRYPREVLLDLHQRYVQNGDIPEIHACLQAEFRSFLKGALDLNESEVGRVLSAGWGVAGRLDGNRIIATKIPKSGNLKAYLAEADPQRRRELYCHCPRVREAIRLQASVDSNYCYCGAGFYKDIWETIVGEPVAIEVLSSVLRGDELCSVAITLPC